jgi:putative aminopeptidase FrvX
VRNRSVNDVTETIKFLEKLSNAFGPSGSEEDVARLLRRELESYADETRVDKLGNILFFHNGKKGYPR